MSRRLLPKILPEQGLLTGVADHPDTLDRSTPFTPALQLIPIMN
jgi:hypothetical protein